MVKILLMEFFQITTSTSLLEQDKTSSRRTLPMSTPITIQMARFINGMTPSIPWW